MTMKRYMLLHYFIKAIRVYEIVEHQGRFEVAEILA